MLLPKLQRLQGTEEEVYELEHLSLHSFTKPAGKLKVSFTIYC